MLGEIVKSAVLENLETIRPGDTVKITESEDDLCFGEVVRMDAEMAEIQWYYKPKDIFTHTPAFIGSKELFSSPHLDTIPILSISSLVEITTLEDYFYNCKASTAYYSRAEYLPETHELQPSFLHWPTICTCKGFLNPDLRYVVCAECQQVYHPQCVKEGLEQLLWYCRNCRRKR